MYIYQDGITCVSIDYESVPHSSLDFATLAG